MSKLLLRLNVALMVVLIALWMGGWVSLTSAGAKEVKPKAPVPETGQTLSSVDGDDGDLQAGVPFPHPRFTDRGNGTVRDNLTGLIWLQLANCFSSRNWTTAVSTANSLVSGQCGLADGSVEGDWRLPNVKEMFSVLNFGFPGLKLSNTEGTGQWVEGDPFSDVRSSEYWTSTSLEGSSETYAFSVDTGSGRVEIAPKIDGGLMWPVSGGN